MKQSEKNIIFGLYDDEEDLKSAIIKANADHLQIMDVLTPFPVHGLDPLLGLSESRLHIGGFIYGMLGTLTAFLGMTWNLKGAVRIGDTIHVHQTVAATRATSKGDRGIVTFDVEVLNQRDEVCQDGQWLVMFSRAPSS